QTWFPFNVEVCLNGREWLARQMDRAGMDYEQRDNCFARVAGVDLQKPRMKAAAQALVALAPAPEGFSSAQLAAEAKKQKGRALAGYNRRQAAYNLRKLRAKGLVERVHASRRYRVCIPRIHLLVGLLVLEQKVIKPVLAGVCRPKVGRPPKCANSLDSHYLRLRRDMHMLLQDLRLVA
ncbi:MAG: hypothetical protein LBK99_08960, partial [Opitutaceae bacterium]|nr:hypothetical protein [Opitutaceae bacterium]